MGKSAAGAAARVTHSKTLIFCVHNHKTTTSLHLLLIFVVLVSVKYSPIVPGHLGTMTKLGPTVALADGSGVAGDSMQIYYVRATTGWAGSVGQNA